MAFFNNFITFFFAVTVLVISSNSQPHIRPRISGGEETEISKFPYLAEFRDAHSKKNTHICNAAIISPHYLLTAAQCIHWISPPSDYTYSVGLSERQSEMPYILGVKNIIIHEKYRKYRDLIHDIALVETDEPIKFNWKIKPIAIGRSFIDGGVEAVVSGFGRSYISKNKHMKYLNVETLTNEDCKIFFPNTIFNSDTFLCANALREKDDGLNNDDPGAPLVFNNTLIGIGSFRAMKSDAPDGYTRISDYVDWIQERVPESEGVEYV